jgi:hypothetical protein
MASLLQEGNLVCPIYQTPKIRVIRAICDNPRFKQKLNKIVVK